MDIFRKNYKLFFGKNLQCSPNATSKYMGGAHYTWQILNKNKEGGVFLQKISKKLDCGQYYLVKYI